MDNEQLLETIKKNNLKPLVQRFTNNKRAIIALVVTVVCTVLAVLTPEIIDIRTSGLIPILLWILILGIFFEVGFILVLFKLISLSKSQEIYILENGIFIKSFKKRVLTTKKEDIFIDYSRIEGLYMAIKYRDQLIKFLKENNTTILDNLERFSKLLKIEYYTDFSSQRRNEIEIITNDNQCFILKNLQNPDDVFYQILRNAYNVKDFKNINESVKNNKCIQQGDINQMVTNEQNNLVEENTNNNLGNTNSINNSNNTDSNSNSLEKDSMTNHKDKIIRNLLMFKTEPPEKILIDFRSRDARLLLIKFIIFLILLGVVFYANAYAIKVIAAIGYIIISFSINSYIKRRNKILRINPIMVTTKRILIQGKFENSKKSYDYILNSDIKFYGQVDANQEKMSNEYFMQCLTIITKDNHSYNIDCSTPKNRILLEDTIKKALEESNNSDIA